MNKHFYIALVYNHTDGKQRLIIRDEAQDMKESLLNIPADESCSELIEYHYVDKVVKRYNLHDLVKFLR